MDLSWLKELHQTVVSLKCILVVLGGVVLVADAGILLRGPTGLYLASAVVAAVIGLLYLSLGLGIERLISTSPQLISWGLGAVLALVVTNGVLDLMVHVRPPLVWTLVALALPVYLMRVGRRLSASRPDSVGASADTAR